MDDFGLREEHLLYRPPLALVGIKLLGVTTRKCQNWGELKERLTSIAKQSISVEMSPLPPWKRRQSEVVTYVYLNGEGESIIAQLQPFNAVQLAPDGLQK